jgi:hypothetical protein
MYAWTEITGKSYVDNIDISVYLEVKFPALYKEAREKDERIIDLATTDQISEAFKAISEESIQNVLGEVGFFKIEIIDVDSPRS